MKANFTDKLRADFKVYLEPLLATACKHQGNKIGISRSKYIRYAVINQLISDGYPLDNISPLKYEPFYERHKTTKQQRAQRILNHNIKKGNIVPPKICTMCNVEPKVGQDGRRRVLAHHEDYNKPLDVVWVCQYCHSSLHNKKLKAT